MQNPQPSSIEGSYVDFICSNPESGFELLWCIEGSYVAFISFLAKPQNEVLPSGE